MKGIGPVLDLHAVALPSASLHSFSGHFEDLRGGGVRYQKIGAPCIWPTHGRSLPDIPILKQAKAEYAKLQ